MIVAPILLSGCAAYRYDTTTPNTNIPNVCPSPVIGNDQLKIDCFLGLNHIEGQFAYGLSQTQVISSHVYLGKLLLAEAGWTWFSVDMESFQLGTQICTGFGTQNDNSQYQKGYSGFQADYKDRWIKKWEIQYLF